MVRRQGQAHPQSLREQVLAALEGGTPPREAAARFEVSLSWIYKTRRRQHDGAVPRLRRAPKLAPFYDAIRAEAARHPEATLAELRAWLKGRYEVSVSIAALWTTLQRLGVQLKQGRIARWNRQPRGVRRPAAGRSNARAA